MEIHRNMFAMLTKFINFKYISTIFHPASTGYISIIILYTLFCILIVGCTSARNTAKKYDTGLTTRMHTGTSATTYNKLEEVLDSAHWSQPYAGNYIDSECYYYESWLRFRPSPKLYCTLYGRTDPYSSEQGWVSTSYGRKTVAFDTSYSITSDFQMNTGIYQHNYEYGYYNPPWSVAAQRDDYGQMYSNYNRDYKRTDKETKVGFTLKKKYSQITTNLRLGSIAYLYTSLDNIPDAGQWSRKYEGNYVRKEYLMADMKWNFTLSPKFRGGFSGATNPDINDRYNHHGYKIRLNTYYRVNPNWELQTGVSHAKYKYGAENPYNPLAWSWKDEDPSYSELIGDYNRERERTVNDFWIGFEWRP